MGDISATAECVAAHLERHPDGGLYSGDGTYIGTTDDEAGDLPDRAPPVQTRDRADGADTRLLVTPVWISIRSPSSYVARGYESPAARRHRRVAAGLYAAIGAGMLEAVPARQVEDTAARYVATIDLG
ncbi:hypothetical protein [Antricoccus suffuscus]|uniref:hypothetical protein n=1 Tax=Antricoccus suffuscus TaxID=1629062 RepID=UPI000D07B4E2|nr:hypothetical protein [Antricoccus suffuscus]